MTLAGTIAAGAPAPAGPAHRAPPPGQGGAAAHPPRAPAGREGHPPPLAQPLSGGAPERPSEPPAPPPDAPRGARAGHAGLPALEPAAGRAEARAGARLPALPAAPSGAAAADPAALRALPVAEPRAAPADGPEPRALAEYDARGAPARARADPRETTGAPERDPAARGRAGAPPPLQGRDFTLRAGVVYDGPLMAQLIVQKYGGSSVADPEKIKNVAPRVADAARLGNRLRAAVSAMGKTTDGLLAL